jgi:hypothetical protein
LLLLEFDRDNDDDEEEGWDSAAAFFAAGSGFEADMTAFEVDDRPGISISGLGVFLLRGIGIYLAMLD